MEDNIAIDKKIEEYSEFVNEKLQPDRDLVQKDIDSVTEQMNGYRELLENVKKGDTECEIDLGHGKVFAKAKADASSPIFVHVGFGFHVEMERTEVESFVEKRLSFLETKTSAMSSKLHQIDTHIQSSTAIIDELRRELEKLGGRAQ